MLVEIREPDDMLVESFSAPAECGDFCDTCGDCLHCYGEFMDDAEWCGNPRLVLYVGENTERIAELRTARRGSPSTETPDGET